MSSHLLLIHSDSYACRLFNKCWFFFFTYSSHVGKKIVWLCCSGDVKCKKFHLILEASFFISCLFFHNTHVEALFFVGLTGDYQEWGTEKTPVPWNTIHILSDSSFQYCTNNSFQYFMNSIFQYYVLLNIVSFFNIRCKLRVVVIIVVNGGNSTNVLLASVSSKIKRPSM